MLVHINPEGCDDDGLATSARAHFAASEVGCDGVVLVKVTMRTGSWSCSPREALDSVRTALFDAGAGRIGEYEHCSWYAAGTGTYLGGERSSPTIGERGKEQRVSELRLETVYPEERHDDVVAAARRASSTRSRRSTSTAAVKATLWTDGVAWEPRPAAYGYVLEAEDGTVLASHGEAIGTATKAVELALRPLAERRPSG